MALPLPALTFEQTAIFLPASTLEEDVLLAIQAAFASLTVNVWTTTLAAGSTPGTANPGIRITAPASSPISNFNAILGAPAGPGTFLHSGTLDYHQSYIKDSSYQNPLWLAIGPDGYTADGSIHWVSDPNAFGTGKRQSGYWAATDASGSINVSTITKVWVVASAETCAICFRYGSDNNCAFMYFGAIVEGINAANVEADDRLYGMCVPGANQAQPMSQTWSFDSSAQKDENLAHHNSANYAHAGVFDPTSADAASFPSTISKRGTSQYTANRVFSSLAFDGGIASSPVQSWLVRNHLGTTYPAVLSGYAGQLRGIYYMSFGVARSILIDTGAAPQGYRMSGALSTTTYDACVFGNG